MGSVIVFCIGTSDIQSRNDNTPRIFKSDEEIRDLNFEELKFPIIKSFFDKLKNDAKDLKSEIEKVIIIGTKQIPQSETDTLFNAHVIKKVLQKEYDIAESKIIVRAFEDNPADYDETYKFFSRIFEEIKHKDRVIINITGGTPALNFSLAFNAIAHNEPGNVEIYYVSKGHGIKKLFLEKFILNEFTKHTFEVLKHRNLYALAAEFADTYLDLPKKEVEYLKAMDAFIKFDFETAEKLFTEVKKSTNEKIVRSAEEKLKILECLKSNDVKEKTLMKLNLLLESMRLKRKNFEYTELVALLFRFYEQLLMICVIIAFGFEADKEYGIDEEKFGIKAKEIQEKYQDEYKKLEESYNKKHKRKLDITKPSIDTYSILIELYLRTENENKEIKEVLNTVKNASRIIDTYKLRELRNKSIYAHGFIGMGKNNIEVVEKLLENFKSILQKLENYLKVFPPSFSCGCL